MGRRQISTIVVTSLFAVFLSAFTVESLGQIAFREMNLSVLKNPSPGYFFVAPNAMDSFAMMDHSGKNMFKTRSGPHANVAPYKGKWITHFTAGQGVACYIRRDINRAVIDTMKVDAPYTTDFHEARILTDTSYLVLGFEDRIVDLSGIVPGGRVDAKVTYNIIQEKTFEGRTLFSWHSKDHIPVTDAADGVELTQALVDYLHINSIWKDTDGNYLASCRHLDEIIKINGVTGDIMWRLGGSKSKHNEFTWLNDTTDNFIGFSHQHSAVRTSSGTLLVFDNGNLKPAPQRSRAIELDIDEDAKTVRRVWEFRPTPDLYAATMGSVQELENGNVLIGWGNGSNFTIAHEVDRDGVVQVQIDNPTANGFTSYRVLKDVFAMTGAFRRITATGTTSFTRGDSTTHVAITWSRVDDTTQAVVERHAYQPHAISYVGNVSCGVLPTRWVVRVKDTALVAGSMVFDIGSVPGVEFPNQITLFHRAKEGQGAFTAVNATYSSTTKKLTVSKLLMGEFMIAYEKCFAPGLLAPANLATELAPDVKLEWTSAVGIGEFQVELSAVPTFQTVYARFSTRRLDTTITAIPDFTTLYWRVRVKRTSDYGPWSTVSKFTTRLGLPVLVSPVLVKDTIAILPSHIFRWNAATGAQKYRLVVMPMQSPTPALDTIFTGTTFVPDSLLRPNTKYTWTVRAINDTIVGRSSTSAFFVTSPPAPVLLDPADDTTNVPTDGPVFTWEEVPGALRYIITIKRMQDSSIVKVDSATTPPLTISTLPVAMRASWVVKAVGKYGPGPDADPFTFTTISTSVLHPPSTIDPKFTSNVDTIDAEFSWSFVEMATFYDLQITSKPNFSKPEFEFFKITGASWTVPNLKPGTTYGWRVIGYNNSTTGRWSDTATFTTVASPSQGLTPISPVTGSIDVPVTGVVTYTTAPRFGQYVVQFDTDPSFTSPKHSFSSINGTCAYTGLSAGTRYFWRVAGRSIGKPDEYGSAASFTTVGVSDVDEETIAAAGANAFVSGEDLIIEAGSSLQPIVKASAYTIQGQLITSTQSAGDRILRLPLGTIARGSYYLIVEFMGGGRQTIAFTKP
ncbi:MAG: aryl-sulfate sulfotransferase [Ignavibacteria bacterium]|nr:aryl-sulfate sulfotransferase [Ignavibacteria bacterium]